MVKHITSRQASDLLKNNENIKLIDVREPEEFAYCKIQNAILCPLKQFPDIIQENDLKIEDKIILYCHHGIRSAKAASLMEEMGFLDLFSIDGGIDAWSLEVDSTVPRY
jgi:rhodanese-related sulfurtransferase